MALESFGVNFLRFQDIDVKQNIEGILIAIEECGLMRMRPVPARHPLALRATPLTKGELFCCSGLLRLKFKGLLLLWIPAFAGMTTPLFQAEVQRGLSS